MTTLFDRYVMPDLNRNCFDFLKYLFREKYLEKKGTEVIKLCSFSPQLSKKFIMLINVKMPKIVGILIFISMINTTFERPKARNFFICRYFGVYEQLKFRAQLN